MLTSPTDTHRKAAESTEFKPHAVDDEHGTDLASAAALAIEIAHHRGDALVLTHGRWSIGSAENNSIVIDDETVSDRHAMIIVTDHRIVMTSWSNATYVNGERCRESLLCAGDRLTVGTVDLKIRAASPQELIAQLPDVDDKTEVLPEHPVVSVEATLRRLQELDTALDLLDDELAGRNASPDRLDSLIGRIEDDLTLRSEGTLPTAAQPDELAGRSAGDVPASLPAGVLSTHVDSTVQPFNLDDVLRVVEPAAQTSRNPGANAAVTIAEIESGFESSSAVSDDDAAEESLPEFARLVGGTSVLAQNMTLNALRSRAEAVRQLDELILAAARANKPPANSAEPDACESAWTSTSSMGGAGADSASESFSSDGAADWDDLETRDDEFATEDSSAADSDSTSECGVTAEAPATKTAEAVATETVDGNDFASVRSATDGRDATEDRNSTDDREDSGVSDAGVDRWEPMPPDSGTFEPLTASDEPWRAGFDSPSHSNDASVTEESEADDAGCETIELSAGDTVNETQSLLSTLFRYEDASETGSTDWEAAAGEISDVATTSSAPAWSEPETPARADEAGESRAASSSSDDVRSRLAEMFDLPSLRSAEVTDDSRRNEWGDVEAGASGNESPAAHINQSVTAPLRSSVDRQSLTTWLDDQKRDHEEVPASPTGPSVVPDNSADDDDSADELRTTTVQTTEKAEAKPAAQHADDNSDEADDEISTYMQSLLARNRLRTGQPANPEQYVIQSAAAPESAAGESQSSPEPDDPTADVETPEDNDVLAETKSNKNPNWLTLQPKHQLDKNRLRAETQTLREVANQTARSAVSKSTRRQLKVQVTVKAVASVLMLCCGVAASLLGVSNIFAIVVQAIGVYFAVDLGLTIARNWKAVKS
ncbi:FHA domain-containing protein [bacterium]|nr:FHA domain-containing protein [bacterium]